MKNSQESVRDEAATQTTARDALQTCHFKGPHCTSRDIGERLMRAGLRLTRQRVNLAKVLFAAGPRHFTAELLHEEAARQNVTVSLATVYNTIQQFTSAGLLRPLPVDGHRTWFDTNTTDHHHMVSDEDGSIIDIPPGYLSFAVLPPVPEGMMISRIEVVVRVERRKD